MRRSILALAALTVVVGPSCGSGFQPGDELDVIVVPDVDGTFPPQTAATCGGVSFALGDLSRRVPIDDAELPEVQRELADFLATGEGEYWVQAGWEVLTESEQRVTLINLSRSDAYFIDFQGSGDGWDWSGASSCDGTVSVSLPAGLHRVDWVLDPDRPAPDSAATQVDVLATEQDCNSGNPMGDRLLGPQVVETVDAVLVTFAVIERTGDADCPSNPATAVTVSLPSPLGDRELREGLYVGRLSELADP